VVVQGSRDAFGTAADLAALGLPGVELVEVPADHAMGSRAPGVRHEVADGVARAVRRVLALAASEA
jgi:predicted alpha/beta-hydrolase family hydrolase